MMRTIPDFGKKDKTKDNEGMGCFQSLWVIVIGYFVLSVINLGFTNLGDRLGQIICLGAVICAILVFVWNSRKKDQEKKEWKRTCISKEVTIVKHEHYDGYESYFDDYGDLHNGRPSYSLELKPTADQKAANPNLTVVRVKVFSDIYEKLEKRGTVRIYYKPDAPFTFLLEEELN